MKVYVCVIIRGDSYGYTQRTTALPPSEKGGYPVSFERKAFNPIGRKFFPLSKGPFSEGGRCVKSKQKLSSF